MKTNMVTIGASATDLSTMGQNKGEFRPDMIDNAMSKPRANDGTKGTPRKQVVPLPKNEKMPGST